MGEEGREFRSIDVRCLTKICLKLRKLQEERIGSSDLNIPSLLFCSNVNSRDKV